jgi:hypothetical protein
MHELEHAPEADPEEEQVDDGDEHGGDLVLPRSDHHGREEISRRTVEIQTALDAIREG